MGLLAQLSQDVSGDFVDMFRVAGRGWRAVIGDVRGKGADVAALAAVACRAVRVAGRVTAPRDILGTPTRRCCRKR